MYLDFYIPESNTAIECQGEQHIVNREKSIMNKTDTFEEKIDRDLLKNDLCCSNGIEIIYIFNKLHSSHRLNERFNHIYDNSLFIEDIENDNSILINKIKKIII